MGAPSDRSVTTVTNGMRRGTGLESPQADRLQQGVDGIIRSGRYFSNAARTRLTDTRLPTTARALPQLALLCES